MPASLSWYPNWAVWTMRPRRLTIVLMPFTYSITAGIGAGFVAYVVLKLVRGKASQVHLLMWVTAALFLIYFAIDPVKNALGVG